MSLQFDHIARLAAPEDNVAIATRKLDSGTQITLNGQVFTLSHDVLLGHRFAVTDIPQGAALRSWGQPFGVSLRAIAQGEYVVNADVLAELQRRSLPIHLPMQANFQNDLARYTFDASTFQPATPLPRHQDTRTFMGYLRDGGRGSGTRNTIILLSTTALTAGFVRALETHLQQTLPPYPNISGIVAVAHTEGATPQPNNRELLLRTLAGWIVHPNVAAVLVVDDEQGGISNTDLQHYLAAHHYPLDAVIHEFMQREGTFETDLARAAQVVTEWCPLVDALPRTPRPLSELKIALQCGGSDAFSGISGNPLAAWVAKEVIQYGGSANLAETDELIGAESYVLDKVRDAATLERFLAVMERFKTRVAWHGHSADGNPSGGNKYRGLYNIYLKSLGAATKRHPDVPLDAVIDYAQRMNEGGYYFMDSPGNDLESIAGQVASGCNLIFFVTGNGSITNFPFVPTIKIVTTTERFELLHAEMDINAGRYLDGTPMHILGAETLDYTCAVASGQLSAGERAGHTQVQIWRNWQQTHFIPLETLQTPAYDGQPLSIPPAPNIPEIRVPMLRNGNTYTADQVALILPTSLCSGQIARLCVDALNKHPMLLDSPITRFVTLVHTEGCGSSLNSEFRDTLLAYLAHPFVRHALLLEHGCESTHNDFFRQALRAQGYDPAAYGWASIQLDGGIQRTLHKMTTWFQDVIQQDSAPAHAECGLAAWRIGFLSATDVPASVAQACAQVAQMIVSDGGTVVIGQGDALWQSGWGQQLQQATAPRATLRYAQPKPSAGLHVMAMPTQDWGERLTGLGAGGVDVLVSVVAQQPRTGHPMIPVLQVGAFDHPELDLTLHGNAEHMAQQLVLQIAETLAQRYCPKSTMQGNVHFQVTRGLLGVSL